MSDVRGDLEVEVTSQARRVAEGADTLKASLKRYASHCPPFAMDAPEERAADRAAVLLAMIRLRAELEVVDVMIDALDRVLDQPADS